MSSLIINYFVVFVLFIMLPRFLTQIADTFSRSWSFCASACLNNCFAKTLLKASTKTTCTSMFVFCCYSSNISIMFFKQLSRITLKLRLIITGWNTWWDLNTPPLFYLASNIDATSLAFLVWKALFTLYIDATSSPV